MSHEIHDHDHDHYHEDHDPISISTHEESIIGVFKSRIPEPYKKAVAIVGAKMKQVAEAVVANGGIIGHIKSFVVAEGERCMISITDNEMGPQEKQVAGESANFELVVIVFHIKEHTLREIIHSAFCKHSTQ
jgi:hypothetical protein